MVYWRSAAALFVFSKSALRFATTVPHSGTPRVYLLARTSAREVFHHHQPTKILRIMWSVNPYEMKPWVCISSRSDATIYMYNRLINT